jgi:hypothetical protein
MLKTKRPETNMAFADAPQADGLQLWPADQVERRPVAALVPYARNARTHSDAQVDQLAGAIREWGWTIPILADEDGTIIAGHGRVLAALKLGLTDVPVMTARGWTEAQKRAYVIADNKLALNAGWDDDMLRVELAGLDADGFALDLLGFDQRELGQLLDGLDGAGGGLGTGALAERFLVPPFSVLNAREGVWQDRKRAWLSLGIESELGRDGGAVSYHQQSLNDLHHSGGMPTGTSIFDPVLCELAYRWFSPPGGQVLDPFAGGSVRGVVAASLGRPYYGVDLCAAQVAANQGQGAAILTGDQPRPMWVVGDSRAALADAPPADVVFSCPPYADLEVYSSDPRDLSTMAYADFLTAYRAIIAAACDRLRPDRFAVWVVGEVRDAAGVYRGLVPDTVRAFQDAGLGLYNEAVLVTMVGTLPIRAGKHFSAARKLGKTHQNVLVFVKGDPKRATLACGDVDVADLDALVDAGADDVPEAA